MAAAGDPLVSAGEEKLLGGRASRRWTQLGTRRREDCSSEVVVGCTLAAPRVSVYGREEMSG